MSKPCVPLLIVCAAFAAPALAQISLPPPASRTVDYDADVRPILAQNCYSCHGPEAQQPSEGQFPRRPCPQGRAGGLFCVTDGERGSARADNRLGHVASRTLSGGSSKAEESRV